MKGATPALRDAVDDVLRPGGGVAVALPGGGVAVIPAPTGAGAAVPGAISSAELAGTIAFSTGLGGPLGPDNTPVPNEPTGPGPEEAPRPAAITPPTNRGGLRAAMGHPPAGLPNPQAHHDLPWTLRDWFAGEGRGLNVNDPAFGRWVSGTPPGSHQRWTPAFEAEWRGFIQRNTNASRQEVLDFMNQLRADPRFQ